MSRKVERSKGQKVRVVGILTLGTLILFLFGLFLSYAEPFRGVPLSTAVFDCEGGLLGARVAEDGQWRVGLPDTLSEKYVTCVLAFEDRFFFKHPGVNPLALMRALWQNLRSGEVVSGGSTITMQVIRLSRGNPPRTISQKFLEMLLAVRLELKKSKPEILRLYAGHAPMGGNVVGLEAAAWRYFGHSSSALSWAEAATLAVLPNAPALIHPGRNREALRAKRNRLLSKLVNQGSIDSLTYSLAMEEDLPGEPKELPDRAFHFVQYHQTIGSGRVHSSIHPELQDRSREILLRHQKRLKANQIHNLAVLILDNQTGDVLAYLGNGAADGEARHGHQVDIIRSERSSGSVLKPFLYAGMLDAGEMLPSTLVADIPTRFADFSPDNFDKEYDGAVPADEALIRSLNIPAVRMLKKFGVLRFYDLLGQLGVNTLHRSADTYGLSLILGGAEISLWNICQVYSTFARQLNSAEDYPLSNPSIYLTLNAMEQVRRPDSEAGWTQFLSTRKMAWKTGTSYGFRDAWAIGLNQEYTVGVWVGNADGEGRPGLTGAGVAAPLLFEIAAQLPRSKAWFDAPLVDMEQVVVCRQSGMLAGNHCMETDTLNVPIGGLQTDPCPYHVQVALDNRGVYRVQGDCYPVTKMTFSNWFILPPVMAWYYAVHHPEYKPLPPWLPGCAPLDAGPLDFIYPHPNEEIFIPKNASGEKEKLLLQAAHQSSGARIFWFLDGEYLGATQQIHSLEVQPEPGLHRISLVDQEGHEVSRVFYVNSPPTPLKGGF